MLPCAALAGPAGSAFLFLPFLLPVCFPPCGAGFSPIWIFRCPRIRPQLAHTAPTGLVLGFVGVVSLPDPQNRSQAHTGQSSFFLPRTNSPLPLKGEGLGLGSTWGSSVFWIRPQLPHTVPTARVWGIAGVASLPGPQNRTQGHTRPSLILTAVFWCALGLVKLPNHAPACNLPPPGWGGW